MSQPPIPFKRLDFEGTAAAVDRVAQSQNIPTLAFPKSEARAGEAVSPHSVTSAPRPASHGPTELVRAALPTYVVTHLKQRALDDKVTVRFLILDALRKSGVPVNDVDMIEDGRRLR